MESSCSSLVDNPGRTPNSTVGGRRPDIQLETREEIAKLNFEFKLGSSLVFNV